MAHISLALSFFWLRSTGVSGWEQRSLRITTSGTLCTDVGSSLTSISTLYESALYPNFPILDIVAYLVNARFVICVFFFKVRFTYLLLTLFAWIFCLHVWMCIMCMLGTHRGQKRMWDPWDWSYKCLWVAMWLLGVNPLSSGRAISTLNCWAIFLAPICIFLTTSYVENFQCAFLVRGSLGCALFYWLALLIRWYVLAVGL